MSKVDNDLFNAAVKALKVSEKMSEAEYIEIKEHILAECADLGEETQAFINDFFEIADQRREQNKEAICQ